MKEKKVSFLENKKWKERTKTMGWRFRWLAVAVAVVGMLAGLFLAGFLSDAFGNDVDKSVEGLCLVMVAVVFCASFVSARCIVAFGELIDDVHCIKGMLLEKVGDPNGEIHENVLEVEGKDAS